MNDNVYSYAEGAYIADKIVKKLIKLGVESNDCIGFLTERSEYYMFCILSILSMGGVYVPIDDSLPDERISFMLEDTNCKVIIVSDETKNSVSNLNNRCAILNISEIINEDIGSLNCLPTVYGDLACILYTSGTTGLPKGVKITRKSIVNVVSFYVDKYGLSNSDVYALFSAIGFDVSNFIIGAVLYSGSCLSVVPEDIRLNMIEMNNYFIKQNVTHAFITTQVGKLFMQSVEDISLDVLLVIGEKLGKVENPDNYELVDGYGPTEAFAFMSSIHNSNKILESSVGHLNYNTKAYVLDNEGRRVPLGAVGELCIAGYQIADGYLNREEETKNAFITNPFEDNTDYGVLYHTGDIVRLLPDESLDFIGRRDSQVKIRGNRVELTEVEAVIREIDYVDDVTVQCIKNEENNELAAYIVVSETFEGKDIGDIVRDHIINKKPQYMVPSYIIELDEIPLNINGKVDKSALPDVNFDTLHAEYVAPATKTEVIIVNAFESIFNQKISVHDDFVKLGGDSLTAIKIKTLIGFDFDVRAIFKERTPYKIAQKIKENKTEYRFELIKKGTKNQNMFLFPSISGLSFVFLELINSIDFEGNIYIIDDYKYDLSIDEIRKITDDKTIINHYYGAIKDIFQDGDIIAAYSRGCINAALVSERLEENKIIGKCILIDGSLKPVNNKEPTKDEIIDEIFAGDYENALEYYPKDLIDKFLEICLVNGRWNLHTPKIKSPIIYLATQKESEEDLHNISDNYEFILIDSTHEHIISRDVNKIIKYFK